MTEDRVIGKIEQEGLEIRVGPDSYDLNPVVKVVSISLIDGERPLLELKRWAAYELVHQILKAIEDEW